MSYKINQVKRILNISEHTLRYFDNKQLIHTRRDQNNNYRYFSSDDINKIFAYKMYRGLLFNMEDSEELISGKPVDVVEEKLKNQLNYVKKEQEYLEGVKTHLEALSDKFIQWKNFSGGFDLTVSTNCYFHGNQTYNTFIIDEEISKTSYQCLNSMPHIWPSFYLDLEDKSIQLPYHFGYGYYTEETPKIKGLIHLPTLTCLHTFFISEDNIMDQLTNIIDSATEHCKKHEYTLHGYVHGNILHEIYEEDKCLRLFEVYLPIVD